MSEQNMGMRPGEPGAGGQDMLDTDMARRARPAEPEVAGHALDMTGREQLDETTIAGQAPGMMDREQAGEARQP